VGFLSCEATRGELQGESFYFNDAFRIYEKVADPPLSGVSKYVSTYFLAGIRMPAAIDRYLLAAPNFSSKARNRTPPLLLSIDGTDRRTGTRPLHRRCCAYYAGVVD